MGIFDIKSSLNLEKLDIKIYKISTHHNLNNLKSFTNALSEYENRKKKERYLQLREGKYLRER